MIRTYFHEVRHCLPEPPAVDPRDALVVALLNAARAGRRLDPQCLLNALAGTPACIETRPFAFLAALTNCWHPKTFQPCLRCPARTRPARLLPTSIAGLAFLHRSQASSRSFHSALNLVESFHFGARPAEIDLASRELRIAIEVDGHYHFTDASRYRRDSQKNFLLQRHGYLVLRFLDEDVVREMFHVRDVILEAVRRRVLSQDRANGRGKREGSRELDVPRTLAGGF